METREEAVVEEQEVTEVTEVTEKVDIDDVIRETRRVEPLVNSILLSVEVMVCFDTPGFWLRNANGYRSWTWY